MAERPQLTTVITSKWLTAGVSDEGEWSKTTVGTPQGAVPFCTSVRTAHRAPLLANVFLHYVFDLWIENWRGKHAQSDVVIVRYADDFVIGFQHQRETERCWKELQQHFAEFGRYCAWVKMSLSASRDNTVRNRTFLSAGTIKLHEGKTRLIEFGKFADVDRQRRGDSRPETFDFLGFTHVVARTRSQGRFTVHRYSNSRRLRATLRVIDEQLRRRMHRPVGETGRW